MQDSAAVAAFLGGLGLFLTGVTALSAAMRQLTGPRLRAIVAAGVASPGRAALAGLGAGAVTQSNMAVTAAAGGLVSAGAMTLRQSLPLLSWTNVGTTGVTLLATLDIRSAALVLIGIGAVLPFFRLDWRGCLRPVLTLLLALGMQLLGASLMKAGVAPLRDSELVLAVLTGPLSAAAPFLLGLAMAFVAASASASNVLAIALAVSGVLDLPHAASLIYGGCVGSGIAQILAGGGSDTGVRRTALYQGLWKIAGAVFVMLLLVAELSGVPLLLALCRAASDDIAGQLAVLVPLYQVVIALAARPLDGPVAAWLTRRVREAPESDLARPRFLSEEALRDPATALDLAAREQGRLLERLPAYLDGVRQDAVTKPPADLAAATAGLEAEVDRFLSRLQATSPEAVDAAARLRNRTSLLAALREATTEVASAAAQATGPAAGPVHAIVESLHALLEDAAEPMPELLDDRTAAMEALRRRVAAEGLDAEGYDALFRATDGFARAVWLLRRMAA